MRKIGIDQGRAIHVAVVTKKVAVSLEKDTKKSQRRTNTSIRQIRKMREENTKKRVNRSTIAATVTASASTEEEGTKIGNNLNF